MNTHSCVCIISLVLAVFVLQAQGYWMSSFSLTGYSAQSLSSDGAASNLLPQNNPSAATSPFWDSADDSGVAPIPYYVSFDLGDVVFVTQFEFKTPGDTIHDPESFELLTSSSVSGPYSTVSRSIGASGLTIMQVYGVGTSGATARYWNFSISATYFEYQAYVSYVNFYVIYQNDQCDTSFDLVLSDTWADDEGEHQEYSIQIVNNGVHTVTYAEISLSGNTIEEIWGLYSSGTDYAVYLGPSGIPPGTSYTNVVGFVVLGSSTETFTLVNVQCE